MPVPTAAEILEAAAINAADGVISATVDGNSATGIDPLKQIQVADKIAARGAIAGTNANGGARSGWNGLRPGRMVPPEAPT